MPTSYPLKALLLIGGTSSRMGTDKASLVFDGQTLMDRQVELLSKHIPEVFLSVACEDKRTFSQPTIRDLSPNLGPLEGLRAAFAEDPKTAWLVVACDLPLFDEATLKFLLEQAEPNQKATCFLNRLDGLPEPLCTLYQPAVAEALAEYLSGGQRCARKFLESLEPQTLELPSPLALDNANRPEQLNELKILSEKGQVEKEVTVTYFGKLSGEAPNVEENRTTTAATLAGLYEEVRLLHHLSLDLDTVKPALADEFVDWTTPLPDKAEVGFLISWA